MLAGDILGSTRTMRRPLICGLVIRSPLYIASPLCCFVSGYDFSRAVEAGK